MNKRLVMVVSLIGMSCMKLFAVTSNFITPLSFEYKPRTYVHYPFAFDVDEDDSCNWSLDGFGVYYQRNACDAFGCNLDCIPADACSDDCNKVTTHTVPLAQLWFGRPSFTVADAFAGGVLTANTGNPFLNFTTFTPRFSYNERGAFIGATVNRYNIGCCKDWFISARIGLPIGTVDVRQTDACNCGSINPDFANAIVHIQQQIPGNGATSGPIDTKTVGVYRLDLLSQLQLPDGTPMVQYGTLTPGSTSGNTRIAGQDITDNAAQVTTQSGSHLRGPIYMYKQSSGKVPFPPNGLTNNDVSLAPPTGQNLMIDSDANIILAADGISGLADGQFGVFGGESLAPNLVFDEQRDYAASLGVNPAAQRQLFLTPVWNASSAAWEEIGLVVENSITRVLEELELNGIGAASFLAEHGIDFGRSDCRTGAGDLFIDIWAGKQKACWFADALIGFRVPTASSLKDSCAVFAQPLGSNGHFGLKLGGEGGYVPFNWLGLKLEFFYTHFFKKTETRAAVFQDSNIRNIGPCVNAQVSWNTFILYADATFFSCLCPNVGFDFGYEFFDKTKDNLEFCVTEIADFAGVVKPLDSCKAANGSATQSHKLRGELFKQWGCFQLFFGGSYIVAGKNVMKETEWHLGMKADF